MNKRDFLLGAGGAAVGVGVGGLPGASSVTARRGEGLDAWRARLHERFDAVSAEGRCVLRLDEVQDQRAGVAGLEQFTLVFTAIEGLASGSGLRALSFERSTLAMLHLQAVGGSVPRYQAHFSLLA